MSSKFKNRVSNSIKILLSTIILLNIHTSCIFNKSEKVEQIGVNASELQNDKDSALNSIQGNVSLNQIGSVPNSVVLTGLADHRLITVYKSKEEGSSANGNNSNSRFSYSNDGNEILGEQHFMPGIDVLFGYYLLNIAHYDMKAEKLNFLFNHPVIIKSLYYPAFVQDSIDKKPITRNYYLVSVYDEDTNKDSLINRKDLRRMYCFDARGNTKIQLVPSS